MGGCCAKEKPREAAQPLLDGGEDGSAGKSKGYDTRTASQPSGSHAATASSSTYRAPDSPGQETSAARAIVGRASGVPIPSTAIPVGGHGSTPQTPKQEKQPNILMRHVVMDPKILHGIVSRADEEFLEVDRSLAGVERDDPEDPANIEFISALRSVTVQVDSFKIGGLPKSALASSDAVVSALAGDALPDEIYHKIHSVGTRIGQAADSVALRDTGTPIVSHFSKAGRGGPASGR